MSSPKQILKESSEENEKNDDSKINKFMSKSVFDKLYDKVLKENFGEDDIEAQEKDALGLDDATLDDELEDEDLGDEGDTVTVTLDKATAEALLDVLKGAVEAGDEDLDLEDEGDDLDFEDEGDDDLNFDEDEEEEGTKVAKDGKGNLMGKDNKVRSHPKPKKKKAKADVTDDTGTEQKEPSIDALMGQNNQVPGSTIKKATDFFK